MSKTNFDRYLEEQMQDPDFAERFKHTANVRILVAVDLAEVARNRVDDDEFDVVALLDLGLKPL